MKLSGGQSNALILPVWRRRLVLIVLLLCFLLLALKSIHLQSARKDYLQMKGSNRYSKTLPLTASRGKIVDRNGEILAVDSPVDSVFINPKQGLDMTVKQKQALRKLLKLKKNTIDKKLSYKKLSKAYLKRRIPPAKAKQVKALGIKGIGIEREYRRYYPAGDVVAHVVGFTNIDGVGKSGVELHHDEALSGKPGERKVIRDAKNHIVEELEIIKAPHDGQELALSIDQRVQYLAFRELAKAVARYQAKAASAVVLDAKTGEVLAMVNLPTYNPNNRVNLKGKTRNRVVTDIFEPGSTMKPIAAAAGLEYGGYKPWSKLDTTLGYMKIGPATIHDSHPSEHFLSVAEIVKKSSNVGAAKIALSLDSEAMWNTFDQLGFGKKTRVGFPGEVRGKVRDYQSWRPIEQATMSYGHGISVTLLQLARAYTVFANNGVLKPVSLLKLKDAPEGEKVFSASVANDVKNMLEMVVQPGGTGIKANVAGYRVAGKTGTAHKLKMHGGGYEKDKYVGSFVGLAPASNPRFIMAVMVDEPSSGEYYGGTVAAPVFSAVMADILRLMAVPQDAPNHNIVIPTKELLKDVEEVV